MKVNHMRLINRCHRKRVAGRKRFQTETDKASSTLPSVNGIDTSDASSIISIVFRPTGETTVTTRGKTLLFYTNSLVRQFLRFGIAHKPIESILTDSASIRFAFLRYFFSSHDPRYNVLTTRYNIGIPRHSRVFIYDRLRWESIVFVLSAFAVSNRSR